MKTVSVEQMRTLDARTINEFQTPGVVLMERAGFGVGEAILNFIDAAINPVHVKRFVVLAGKGNNGGDGYVVARYLYARVNVKVVIYSVCNQDELTNDAAQHAALIQDKIELHVKQNLTQADFNKGDIIIDALLGIGITGALKEPYRNWINVVNSSSLPVISLDIPSGLDGNSGTCQECINADMTVTVGLPKTGLVAGKGPEVCGLIKLVDIGIPQKYIDEIDSPVDLFLEVDASKNILRIPMNSHKNSVGSVLVIGGSREYYGAPFLAARSAFRGGAGLVRVAIPDSVKYVPAELSLIVSRLRDNGDGYFCKESLNELEQLIEKSDVIVAGPGIGTHRDTIPFLRFLCSLEKPVVFDADALNLISEIPKIYREKESNILTPHPGEMKRLLNAFDLEDECGSASRIEQARKLAQSIDSTIVLKGHRTVTASPDGRITVNSSGCPALATAGSGDCLSGLIGACVINREDIFEAVATAVYIHGLAGELSKYGNRGTIADDLPDLIPEAIKYISPFA
ncbi:MAG: NAD(P)H-hydrate dehydratase [Victivallaceae bacterium]